MTVATLPLGHALIVSCRWLGGWRRIRLLLTILISRPVPQFEVALLQVLELGDDAFVPLRPVWKAIPQVKSFHTPHKAPSGDQSVQGSAWINT